MHDIALGSLIFRPPDDSDTSSKKKLGSLVFRRYENGKSNKNDANKKLLCSFWKEGTDNRTSSIVKMESTCGVFTLYQLLNDELLNNNNNIYNLSFMDLLQQFKQGELKKISEMFTTVAHNNEFYSETLEIIKKKAEYALDNVNLYENDNSNNLYIDNLTITKEEYSTFNNYVETYFKTLNTIKKSVQIYIEFEAFKYSASKYATADAILHNDLSLNEYISNIKSNKINNLNVEANLNITPKLDPYIKEYVNIHGWPSDGLFDSELMSKIIINKI